MRYRFGLFEYDDETSQLRKNNRPVPLEPQPTRMLAVLLARAGELVSRDELQEHIWGRETHVDFDRGLAYCLSQVRASLGDRGDNPRFIQTVPRRGYRFIAPVSIEPPVLPSPQMSPGTAAPSPPRQAPWEAMPWRAAAAVAGVTLTLLLAAWYGGRPRVAPVLVAVSVFDNETGLTQYDRVVAGLADLVVVRLANLAPNRLAVMGNADALRRPRNIRSLSRVATETRADYILLGQLQQGEEGLRFVTHFIRARDLAHLKADRVTVGTTGMAALETVVVDTFERAVREHILRHAGN